MKTIALVIFSAAVSPLASAVSFDDTKPKSQGLPSIAELNHSPEKPTRVRVQYIVDTAGYVRDPFVTSSSAREFELDALKIVSRWRFVPAQREGKGVDTRRTVDLEFSNSGVRIVAEIADAKNLTTKQ